MIDYSQFGLMDSLAMLAVGVFVYNIIMIKYFVNLFF